MLNDFIQTIDKTLLGATTPVLRRPGTYGNEVVLGIPKTPALLEPHH